MSATTALATPDRPEEGAGRPQHQTALELANTTRLLHAAVKRSIRLTGDRKAQRRRVAELLVEPSGPASTMKVADLLTAPLGAGDRIVEKLLERCRISPFKRVGQLQPRQAEELGRLFCDEHRAEQATFWEEISDGGR